ncbi:hypothetical protein ACFWXA_27015, partial [Streptomyces atroolivaceus]
MSADWSSAAQRAGVPPVPSARRTRRGRDTFRFKALPPDAEGLTVGALAAERRNLFTGGFTT